MSKPIALVTVDAARDVDEDLPPLIRAFSAAGLRVETPSWDDASIDWSRYALALLRSTWNYTEKLPVFLDWCARTARQTLLLNPTEIVRWNTDKRYLADLASVGVAIIPSWFARDGEPLTIPESAQCVVKPSVGAGSRGARRFRRADREAALRHAAQLQAAGFTAMAQPYFASVDTAGETVLMFFDGVFSHSIRKGPLLQLEGAEVQGLFAREDLQPRQAAADEIALAQRAVAAIRGGAPLYARVDLIRDAQGAPRVLELELTEPSLFFDFAAGSAERYVAACLRRLR